MRNAGQIHANRWPYSLRNPGQIRCEYAQGAAVEYFEALALKNDPLVRAKLAKTNKLLAEQPNFIAVGNELWILESFISQLNAAESDVSTMEFGSPQRTAKLDFVQRLVYGIDNQQKKLQALHARTALVNRAMKTLTHSAWYLYQSYQSPSERAKWTLAVPQSQNSTAIKSLDDAALLSIMSAPNQIPSSVVKFQKV